MTADKVPIDPGITGTVAVPVWATMPDTMLDMVPRRARARGQSTWITTAVGATIPIRVTAHRVIHLQNEPEVLVLSLSFPLF